jgi:hypothetical protein
MGCVDFTRLRWPSQIWVFEGSLSITSSISFAGSGTTGHAVLQLNASSVFGYRFGYRYQFALISASYAKLQVGRGLARLLITLNYAYLS